MDVSENKNSTLISKKMRHSILLLDEIVDSINIFIDAVNPPFSGESPLVSSLESQYYGKIRMSILKIKECILTIEETGNVVKE